MMTNQNSIYILILILLFIIVYVIFNIHDRNILISKKDIEYSQDYIRNHIQESSDRFNAHWFYMIKHYLRLPLENSYGSHKLALLAALILTSKDGGSVLEMGCGYHSTILLHQIAVNEQKRYVLSTDTDYDWLLKFEGNMSSSLHQFHHINLISQWDNVGNDRSRWSIVLIDHKPGERRVIDIIRLVNMTDIIIIHDTETSSYQYERGLFLYPYRYHYTYLSTATDIASKSNVTLLQGIQYLLELTITLNLPK